MRQTLLFVAIFIAATTQLTAQETVEAKNWLTTAIEEYFAEFPPKPLNKITTDQYAEYKQDALCVVYDCDNSLTNEQFEQKWESIYDMSFSGIGEGFLIDQQDWDNITVTKCELISQPKSGTYIFDTVISDKAFDLTHSKEITVLRTADGFKINDVTKRK